MNIETEKIALVQMLLKVQKESVLREIKDVLLNSEIQNEFSEEEIESIKKGRADIEANRLTSNEEVKKEIRLTITQKQDSISLEKSIKN